MNFSGYQRAASKTSYLKLGGPDSAIAPLLGLASEAGQILNVFKKYLRDSLDPTANREFLKEELGDLLWFIAAVATSIGLDMSDIAKANLQRTRDWYPQRNGARQFASLPVLDASYPKRERFPRLLVVAFKDKPSPSGSRVSSLKLVRAQPNAFPKGPIMLKGKQFGYKLGVELGAPLTDNSRHVDDYRFHDALHLGFMAVLGWSPTIRALLRIKRKSHPSVDGSEDGARAVYAEEGLSAILARLAPDRGWFQQESNVDGDALVIAKAATTGLEVGRLPAWLWRRAINQGFVAMRKLGENGGGFLTANLDAKKLEYSKVRK